MHRSARLAVLLVTAVAAVAAFVALRDADRTGGDAAPDGTVAEARTTDETPPAGTGQPSPPSTSTSPAAATEPSAATASTRATPAATAPTTVTVRNGRPVGGVVEVTVAKGRPVDLRITTDAADEVHVHGYDLTTPLRPGTPARLRFVAELEGIFEIELHGSGEQLVRLVVEPG